MRRPIAAIAALLVLSIARPASAQLLTFDDIMSTGNPDATVFVPALYKGFMFGGVNTANGDCGSYSECDWVTNLDYWTPSFPTAVSSPVSLWANADAVLTLSRATAFNFTSGYFGADFGLCYAGGKPTMTLTGYRSGMAVNSAVIDLTCSGFALQTVNFTNVDEVSFSAPSVLANARFDDFLVSDVTTTTPEPATLALLGTGLLAVGGMARRRRKA